MTTRDGPFTLNILSHPVTVQRGLDRVFENEVYGITDRHTLEVQLSDRMSPSMTVMTLFHELVHVGETILGVSFQENEVDAIAATFYSLLVDNPELGDWIEQLHEHSGE